MTNIYITDAVFTFDENKTFLQTSRKTELEKINNKKVRDEKTTSSILLDFAINTIDKSIPLPAPIIKDINGKPQLKDIKITFNCSHSHGICACVISDCEVGLDIEKDRELKSFAAAKKIFANEELIWFNALQKNKSQAFLKHWTAVESRLKLSGEGLKGLYKSEQDAYENYSFYFYTIDTHITCTTQKNITPQIAIVGSDEIKRFLNSF